MIEILVSLLILVGVFFTVAASIGLVRLPDVYTRMHAATKASTLGVSGILLASVIFFSRETGSFSIKQILAILFLFLTNPVGAHMIARAAYRTGVKMWHGSVLNHLQEQYEPASVRPPEWEE